MGSSYVKLLINCGFDCVIRSLAVLKTGTRTCHSNIEDWVGDVRVRTKVYRSQEIPPNKMPPSILIT